MKARISLIPLLIVAIIVAPRAYAGPTVLVGRQVAASDRVSVQEISHDEWHALVSKYVDQEGMVDYQAWQTSTRDVERLDDYLDHLSTARFTKNDRRAARLAYWINAYNAVTIKGILREYPTSSIRNHTAKLFGYNIWKNLKLQVDDRQISLDAMEHEILRKMGEPRIHFAIVCASIGCPRLLNEAYVPQQVDAQLTTNAQAFFKDPAKFRIQGGRLYLSPILNWFAADFGSNQAAQLKTISAWVPDSARALVAQGKAKVTYLDYDWGLNDQRR